MIPFLSAMLLCMAFFNSAHAMNEASKPDEGASKKGRRSSLARKDRRLREKDLRMAGFMQLHTSTSASGKEDAGIDLKKVFDYIKVKHIEDTTRALNMLGIDPRKKRADVDESVIEAIITPEDDRAVHNNLLLRDSETGRTALHHAVLYGNIEFINAVLKYYTARDEELAEILSAKDANNYFPALEAGRQALISFHNDNAAWVPVYLELVQTLWPQGLTVIETADGLSTTCIIKDPLAPEAVVQITIDTLSNVTAKIVPTNVKVKKKNCGCSIM